MSCGGCVDVHALCHVVNVWTSMLCVMLWVCLCLDVHVLGVSVLTSVRCVTWWV